MVSQFVASSESSAEVIRPLLLEEIRRALVLVTMAGITRD